MLNFKAWCRCVVVMLLSLCVVEARANDSLGECVGDVRSEHDRLACHKQGLQQGTEYTEHMQEYPVQPVTGHDVQQLRRYMERQRRTLRERQRIALQRVVERSKAYAKRQKAKEQRAKKCIQVREKIANVEQEYRSGYTAKRGKALEKKMLEYKRQRRKYCRNE